MGIACLQANLEDKIYTYVFSTGPSQSSLLSVSWPNPHMNLSVEVVAQSNYPHSKWHLQILYQYKDTDFFSVTLERKKGKVKQKVPNLVMF